MSLALKIIQERKSKGLTQEELADQAGLTLRTVQRIERGESIPRGYTLKALAAALQKPLEEFSAFLIPRGVAPEIQADDQATITGKDVKTEMSLQWLNLSALAYLVIPFGNLILPFLIWRRKKHNSIINQVGKRIINYQLLWSVFQNVGLLLALFFQLIAVFYFEALPGFSLLTTFFILHLTNVPVILYASVQLKKMNYNIYNIGLRLIW